MNIDFRIIINLSWKLLIKYYKKIDKYFIYIIIITLNSWFKFQYFEWKWKKKWINEVKQKLDVFYNQYKQEKEITQVIKLIIARTIMKILELIVIFKSLDISEFLWDVSIEASRDELKNYCNDLVLHFQVIKRERILISWNIKKRIIRYIQYWHEFSSIYALYLIYQQS